MTDEHNAKRTAQKAPDEMIHGKSRRQWTDEEAQRFVEFFKAQAPTRYCGDQKMANIDRYSPNNRSFPPE